MLKLLLKLWHKFDNHMQRMLHPEFYQRKLTPEEAEEIRRILYDTEGK